MASRTTMAPERAAAQNPAAWVVAHALFATLAVTILLQPLGSLGLRVLLLVVAYTVGAGVVAFRTGDETALRWWFVLMPLSALMVLPDWFLSDVLGVLVFPDTGAPFLGTVPVFMAGMWLVALLPVMLVGRRVEASSGLAAALAAVVVGGLLLFTAAEWFAPTLPLWYPQNVWTVAGVAPYVLLPEAALTLATYLLVRGSVTRSGWATAAGIVAVPFLYLGMLATAYQLMG